MVHITQETYKKMQESQDRVVQTSYSYQTKSFVQETQVYKCYSQKRLEEACQQYKSGETSSRWPPKSSEPCDWCHRYFTDVPAAFPVHWNRSQNRIWFTGNYCSWNCTKAHSLSSTSYFLQKKLSLIGICALMTTPTPPPLTIMSTPRVIPRNMTWVKICSVKDLNQRLSKRKIQYVLIDKYALQFFQEQGLFYMSKDGQRIMKERHRDMYKNNSPPFHSLFYKETGDIMTELMET